MRDIWQDDAGKLPEDKLMAYLEGRLTRQEQHEVEAWLAAEGMEADALEGLKEIPFADTKQMVSNINRNLHSRINKDRRKHRPITENKWAWLAILVVLLLCVLGYIILKLAAK